MDEFKRYGIYVVPTGAFFDAASAWLGWNSALGAPVGLPNVPNLPAPAEALTATPRKYGFHGTIKPPFAICDGHRVEALDDATRAFCDSRSPVIIPRLAVQRLGRFVAVVPTEPSQDLASLASATVQALDPFRAPPSEAELTKRRKAGLSDRQEALLQQWGYPYVMEEFRFHLTLTGPTNTADAVVAALADHFAPILPQPFVIDSLALMGEDAEGRFHLVQRYGLAG
jgi:putative phosphonate metabolism protein